MKKLYKEQGVRNLTTVWGRPLFVSSLYATSCMVLVAFAGYFEFHRRETFEAVHRGQGPVPFSVKFSVKGEKVNLYLRLGLAMFGLMSIGHVAIKFAEESINAPNDFFLHLKSILEMAFFVLQTLFILRYHRLVILRYNEVLGAGLVHLLTTNLCVWADLSVGKIDKTLSYGRFWRSEQHRHIGRQNLSSYASPNTTANLSGATQSLDLVDVSFYLLPTVSEYCLLAAALLYEITVRIGQPSFIEIEKPKQPSKTLHDCRGCSTSVGAWMGLIAVLLVVALTIITSTAPKYADRTENFWKSQLILTEEAVLCFFGIASVLIASLQMRKLKFSIATRQSHMEEFLLYIAFFFSANYNISTIILAADFEEEDRRNKSMLHKERYLLIARCTVTTFVFVQILLQTYMIQDSFHRCSEKVRHQVKKPGRQAIVALLGINLAFWIQQSFQLKNADILFLIESERGTYGWILFVVTMPISLFYRYHCTVCMSQCFNKIYEDETQRFEEIWRYRVDPITDMVIPPMGSLCMIGQSESTSPHEPKLSDASNSSLRDRRQAMLAKTKPWKTIDIADDGDISGSTSLGHGDALVCKSPADHDGSLARAHSDDQARCGYTSGNEHAYHQHWKRSGIDEKIEEAVIMEDGHENNSDVCKPTMEEKNTHNASVNKSPVCEHGLITGQNYLTIHGQSHFKGLGRERNSKSNIPAYRRQTVSLILVSSKQTDHPKPEHEHRNSGLNKSPRHSLTRYYPSGQPLRRRRTLRNLETAKYRVLAAEIAHRMVIERGVSGTSETHQENIMCKFTEESTPHSPTSNRFALASKSATPSSGRSEFRVAQAMSETAAITIAPVEAQLAANLQHPTSSSHSGNTSSKASANRPIHHNLLTAPSRMSLLTISPDSPRDSKKICHSNELLSKTNLSTTCLSTKGTRHALSFKSLFEIDKKETISPSKPRGTLNNQHKSE